MGALRWTPTDRLPRYEVRVVVESPLLTRDPLRERPSSLRPYGTSCLSLHRRGRCSLTGRSSHRSWGRATGRRHHSRPDPQVLVLYAPSPRELLWAQENASSFWGPSPYLQPLRPVREGSPRPSAPPRETPSPHTTGTDLDRPPPGETSSLTLLGQTLTRRGLGTVKTRISCGTDEVPNRSR